MEDTEDEYDDSRTIVEYAKDTLLAPVRIATSPTLLRTYLRTALLFITSSILLGVAVVAYTSFYYAYIPIRGIEVPVYLQYDHTSPHTYPPAFPPPPPPAAQTSPADTSNAPVPRAVPRHPFGIANVQGLVSRQKYDVVVGMDLPRSAPNLEAGNWMIGLEIRGPTTVGGGVIGLLGWDEEWDVEDYTLGPSSGRVSEKSGAGAVEEKPRVLARSRRPAILVYRSWMTEVAYRTLRLPLYVLGFGTESEKVQVRLMEGVEFERGWRNVPASVRLEIRAKRPLEVYKVTIRFAAKLEGLRWVMYTHRFASFVVFTGVFWAVEMGVVLLTWAVFSFCFAGAPDKNDDFEGSGKRRIKSESGVATPKTEQADGEGDETPLSDASRTFPTLPSHRPLHYSSPNEGRVKREGETPGLDDVPVKEEAEADDEDDDFLLDEARRGMGCDASMQG
ncbi:hypothetical protein K458DRAFT_191140 [Lentithecium fluviatile CBS 122367]|uniref:Adipose-regulatory protein-like protein n=1 Tax=Lentithecium fluviatile CBS 122367 TaxID=1168545 RepID=A0A6G1JA69_9PLEO|nr:hypothetical protein K458DRAFT_191140 [Lentithecium fluviatile CBS 122367]